MKKIVKKLSKIYNLDSNGIELFMWVQNVTPQSKKIEPKTPLEFITIIISYEEDAFPNLRVALQILLYISVSIASCERSFSKLKLILTYLRSTIGQHRPSDVAFLSKEREKFEMINFDNIIDKFASSKERNFFYIVVSFITVL